MVKPKITKVVTFCITQDGVQACASTEKKALALLEKTLKEHDNQK